MPKYFLLFILTSVLMGSCAHKEAGDFVYYKVTVRKGDSINALAKKYRIPRMHIVKANPTVLSKGLRVGERIFIPVYENRSVIREKMKRGLLFSGKFNGKKMASAQGLLFDHSAAKASSKVTIDYPVKGKLTSKFGMRRGRPHHGIDISAPTGQDIFAANAGIVEFVGWQRGYGRTIILSHNNGKFKTLYAHLSKRRVKKGIRVARGQHIGDVGATGRATGPHLHFELRDKRNIPVDPLPYLNDKALENKGFLFGSL